MTRTVHPDFGDWRGLASSSQAPRYEALASLLLAHNVVNRVLDVGCGEALLRNWLPATASYTGIDLSAEAIARAKDRNVDGRLVHGNVETWPGDGVFAGIVFNEVLYYLRDPIGTVRRYAEWLAPGGIVVCSIYQSGRASLRTRLMHTIDRRRPLSNVHCERMVRTFMQSAGWPITDNRIVENAGITWHIWVARP